MRKTYLHLLLLFAGLLLGGLEHGLAATPALLTPGKKEITFQLLPPELQSWLAARGLAATNFTDFIASLRRQTEARERNGEFEHLIYFALQSSRFTAQAKIEPALSAYEFIQRLPPAEQARYLKDDEYLPQSLSVPKPVAARLQALLSTLQNPLQDERLTYFRQFLAQTVKRPEAPIDRKSMRV